MRSRERRAAAIGVRVVGMVVWPGRDYPRPGGVGTVRVGNVGGTSGV